MESDALNRVVRRRATDAHELIPIDQEEAVRARVASARGHVSVLAYGPQPLLMRVEDRPWRGAELVSIKTGADALDSLYVESAPPAPPRFAGLRHVLAQFRAGWLGAWK